MVGFRDMTFCTDKSCKKFAEGCKRAYTEEVHKAATEWWGSQDYPICTYVPSAYPLDCKEPK